MPSEDVTVPEETEEEPEPEGNEGTEEADALKTFENIMYGRLGVRMAIHAHLFSRPKNLRIFL
ncbi:hypothetical protein [Bacillus testis]|uniref:hypothetical protein n=1 Tax=Bacillus testis TaxID=1622072 RepID=UPI00067F40CA|nr:hypothetical protein [Bacillus testis]